MSSIISMDNRIASFCHVWSGMFSSHSRRHVLSQIGVIIIEGDESSTDVVWSHPLVERHARTVVVMYVRYLATSESPWSGTTWEERLRLAVYCILRNSGSMNSPIPRFGSLLEICKDNFIAKFLTIYKMQATIYQCKHWN